MKNNNYFLNLTKIFGVLLTSLASTLFFTGCPVYVNINAVAPYDGTTPYINYNFSTTAGEALNEFISSIDQNADTTQTMFDTLEIEKALHKMNLSNVSATTLKTASTEVLKINFSTSENHFDFIKFTKDPNRDNIVTKAEITLSPEILQSLLTEQNNIIQKYADLLMAPCLTGDAMTKEEYIDLVASLYGQKIADELTAGSVTISVKNSRAKKFPQKLEIPLIDILILTGPKTFTINY